ncbi:protein DpdE [Nonomuraea sp. NPDC049625]|uniref:protein DpdE n=1 Tax=Nonomuraea sp. NPDC049625 TaxID=3155775 RepID=UPI003430A8B3
MAVGRLVEYPGSPGVGRVGEITGAQARIDFFESVAEPVAHSEVVPVKNLQRAILERETRVYRRNPDTGDWLAGRVMAVVDGRHYVTFPNVDYDFPVAEEELRVRWNRPISSPVSALTAGGNESAYYYNARLPFLHNLVSQRAASASTPALLSSAAEIFPHQISTALTVLSDPVQRYLLADEVGLGKTVQAGFIIRQTLIDNPRARICLIVPDVLRRQWIGELRDKFFIDDFPGAKVKCSAHETPENWSAYHGYDLVVVDEVHRLVQVTDPDKSPYRELADLAHSSLRLLLLSATPVMSHYLTQLAMLHLLDQHLYSWEDREGFQRKYQLRSQLANSVFMLDSDFTYALPSAVDEIRSLIPESDHRFNELSCMVLDLLDENDELRAGVDQIELKARTEALRAHIGEAYRLHRRVIRHRRHTVLREDPNSIFMPYEVRGRVVPEVLSLGDSVSYSAAELIEQWRSQVWDHLLDHGLEDRKHDYAMVLAVLAARGFGFDRDLESALAWRINKDEAAALRAGLAVEERALLSKPQVLDVELELLQHIAQDSDDRSQAQLASLTSAMRPALETSRRAVVFCGPGPLAGQLVERFKQEFLHAKLFEHSQQSGPEASATAVRNWAATTTTKSVLVVDESAEDGLNLQVADAVIHVRLPWSPNRFEQRIGRVDRYRDQNTPLTPARMYRLGALDSESSFLDAWSDLFAKGYHIFDESVSTLQDAIAEGLTAVWTAALERGPEGLRASAPVVKKQLAEARQEIDKMDMLEAIHDVTAESSTIAEALIELEANWAEVKKSMLDYTADAGGIRLRHTTRTINLCEQTIFSIRDSRPLIDPRLWLDAKYRLGGHPEFSQGTFHRSHALRASRVRLFRQGNPLVDTLARAVYFDDRGQASAFRRIDQAYTSDPIAYFGFDLLAESDLTDALRLVASHSDAELALRRQADRLLPPFTLKVWVEAGSGTPITNPQSLRWLNRPYDNRRDRNYNRTNISQLLDAFGGWDGYARAATHAERSARELLAETTDLVARCEEAQVQARQRIAITRAQAQARQAAGHLVGDAESLITDTAVTEALVAGLTRPVVKVIAVTCLVRSGPGGAPS